MTAYDLYANITTGASGCASGDESGRLVYDSGPQQNISDVNVSVFATVNGSADDYGFYCRYLGASGWVEDQGQQHLTLALAQSWAFSFPAGVSQFELLAYARGVGCVTATLNVTVSGTWIGTNGPIGCTPSSGACVYGTQRKDLGTFLYYLTPAVIDAASTLLGLPSALAAAAFTAFYFTKVSTVALCGSGPPQWPAGVTLDTLEQQNLDVLQQCLYYVLWPYLCECTPAPLGSPAPTDYSCASPPSPTGIQPQPIFSCDEADLCTMLNQLSQLVSSVSAIAKANATTIQLIQRQKVPFAYVAGTLHSGLTGAGQFAVQGILGLAVQVTTIPGASGEEAGDPIARFGLGWVTTGTADGWRKSVPIRHNPQWVDVEPDDTLIGYSLEALVVANIEEFVREP